KIEHRPAGITGFFVLASGVDVTSLLDEQLYHIERWKIRKDGGHQGCAPQWIHGIRISAAIEHHADQVHIAECRYESQGARVCRRTQVFCNQEVDAFRTLRSC